MFKKIKMLSLALTLVLSVQSANLKQAHAIGGISSISRVDVIAGAFLVAVGAAFVVGGIAAVSAKDATRTEIIWGVIFFIFGVVLLPQDNGAFAVEFKELKGTEALSANLPAEAVHQYNQELPQINLAAQEIHTKINSGEITDLKQTRDAWVSYRDQALISPQAFKVLETISNQNLQLLTQASK